MDRNRTMLLLAVGGLMILTGGFKLTVNPADPWVSLALIGVGVAIVVIGYLRGRKPHA
jgi:hypothetical protein